MAIRGLITRIPLWIRLTATIAVVLAGIVVSARLLDTSGGEHGPGDGDRTGDHRPGGGHTSVTPGGGHGSGGHSAPVVGVDRSLVMTVAIDWAAPAAEGQA